MNHISSDISASVEVSDAPVRVAFIQASWHSDIVACCRGTFEETLRTRAGNQFVIDDFRVPGAFEIPLKAKRLAATGRYDAIVAAGLVVDGGIYRHDFVADAVISGLMRVQLDSDVPVLSVVLTPHHFHSHADHHAFFSAHFEQKGREAAEACLGVTAPSYA